MAAALNDSNSSVLTATAMTTLSAAESTAAGNPDTAENDYEGDSTITVVTGTILMVLLPMLVLVGICGNSMAMLLVTSNSALKRLPSNTYLSILALSSTIFLIVIGYQWFESMVGWHYWTTSGVVCKSFTWLGHSCDFLSAWLVVALSVERMTVLYKFSWRKRYCNATGANRVLYLLLGFTLGFNSWTLFLANIRRPYSVAELDAAGIPPNQRHIYSYCGVLPSHERAYTVLLTMETILGMVLPALIITTTNVCVILKLRYYRRFLPLYPIVRFHRLSKDGTGVSEPIRTDGSAYTTETTTNGATIRVKRRTVRPSDLRLTKTLLVITTLFIFFNLPTYVSRFMDQFASNSSTDSDEEDSETPEALSTAVFKLCAFLMSYAHHAGLFYIYIFHSPQMKKQLAPMAIKLLECDCLKPVPGLMMNDL